MILETLNVAGMLKLHSLAGSIQDASWSEFVRQLEYKAEWQGKNIIRIGRFEASSKTCSCCGSINQDLTLADREWTCTSCHTHHDRDVNAATNIKKFGLIRSPEGHDLTVPQPDSNGADQEPNLTGQELPEVPVEVSRRKGNRRSRKSSSPAASAAD